jgi:hypothetical protein
VGAHGDNSWAQADTMGTQQAVFVEDSTFNITNAVGHGSIACQAGGRCVARYNRVPFLGTHGNDSSHRTRSIRHFEIYNNTINDNGSALPQAMQLRGGTALFFNNTITPTKGSSYKHLLATEIYREVNQWSPWGPISNGFNGGCDGTGPFDNNDGIVYDSGTNNGIGGITDVVTDRTKRWTPNQWVGYSLVHNSTTGIWGSSILSNTATTITTYNQTQKRAISHLWNPADGYKVLKVYPCLDQVGRGAGDYISGGGFAIPPTPTRWPHQAVDPVYAWNNRQSGVEIPAVFTYYTHIQANRDYYDWNSSFNGTTGVGEGLLSARPATCTPLVAYWATDQNTLYQCATPNTWTVYYKPYAYPHPLNGGNQLPAPASPKNLKVTVVH